MIEDIETGDAIAHVATDIGAEMPLLAIVTRSSLDQLELEPGRKVMASFKATATQATPQNLDTP